MQRRYLFIILFLIAGTEIISGQKSELKELKQLVENGQYVEGLKHTQTFDSNKKEFFFHRGLCYFYLRQSKNAHDDLSQAYSYGYNKDEIIYFLARNHHLQEQFREAAQAYKLYLTKLDKNDPLREDIKLYIKQCGYGQKAIYNDQPGFVENLGSTVNTFYDDYSPVYSPNYEKKIYFSSRSSESIRELINEEELKPGEQGSYSSDIYSAEFINDEWERSKSVLTFLNTAANEEIQDFCTDGTVMVFNRLSKYGESVFFVDTFSTDLNNKSEPFLSPAVSSLGDKDIFFVNDSTFIFSSKRINGFGGYDLYITARKGGKWTEPLNLGPQINSLYDERSPYLSHSGTLLYFSSNRENSFGGYDIYKSNFGVERQKWQNAENVGFPISSPGDDLYFKLGQDGRSALFSSDRMNTLGGQDIFIAYLKNQVVDQLTTAAMVPFLDKEESGSAIIANNPVKEKSLPQENSPGIKTREIVISPLSFSETNNVIEGNNLVELQNLVDIMLIYPETKVVLSGYTASEGNKAYELYFSIKRAEIVADYLMDNGIEGNRITLFGYGAQYPMVLDKESSLAFRNNQRVDIQLVNNNPSLIINYNNSKIVEVLQDKRFQLFEAKKANAIYRVKALQSRQLVDNPIIIGAPDLAIFKTGSDELYTYMVGLSKSYKEIDKIKSTLSEAGLRNLSILAFLNDIPLKSSDVVNYVETYPNLKEYGRKN